MRKRKQEGDRQKASVDSRFLEFRATVQARIQDRMAARGKSKKDLAEAIGMGRSTISNWLSTGPEDVSLPTITQLAVLAETLSTSCDYLLGRVDDPAPADAARLRLPRVQADQALTYLRAATKALSDALDADVTDDEPEADATLPRSTTPPSLAKRVRGVAPLAAEEAPESSGT